MVGALIFIFAATRLNRSPAGISWLSVILGIWTFVSPWVYGYTSNTGGFVNGLCVGLIVFVAALTSAKISANAMPHGRMSNPRYV
jgi:hypothetical protein